MKPHILQFNARPNFSCSHFTLSLTFLVLWTLTSDAASVRFDIHKAEAEYQAMRDRDENGQVPPNAQLNALAQAQKMSFNPAAWPVLLINPADQLAPAVAGIDTNLWTWIGPGNIGGRIRSILIHPTLTNTMWIGGVDGGIWKTTNGGAAWFPLNDFLANLAVSCMVMDPTNPNTIYVGTGEPMYNIDSVRGAGIFKTTDGGNTWTQLSATTISSFYYVSRLTIDPNNSQTLLASTRSGIFRSTDGGSTWSQTSTTETLDVAFHPSNSSLAIASGYGNAYYSLNGGISWNAASGFAASSGYRGGRIEIAYAPSSPTTVYASYDSGTGVIYSSTDGGQTYALISSPGHLSSQGWYDNCIWVDPTNPNLVVIGGTDVFRSSNGGVTFTDIGGYTGSIHPDQHALVGIPGYNGSTVATLFVGDDGGIFRASNITSVSSSSGWTTLNNNLGITQFYGAAGNTISGTIVGGTQDNGTLRALGNGATGSWTSMFGGDGGFSAADQSNTNYFYGEYVYLQIHRSSNGGVSSSYITSGLGDAGLPSTDGTTNVTFYPPDDKTPPGDDPDGGAGGPPPDPDSAANFIAPFILDPNNFNTLLAGGSNLWRSANVKAATPTWSNIKNGLVSGSFINAVAVAPGNSDIVWVGYNNGEVDFTVNGTSATPTWTQSGLGSLPSRACTRLTVDPNNSAVVYACFGGYNSGNVYKSTNSGASWVNIGSALPSAPVNSLVVAPFNSNYIYVGMNVGVFASADGGATWSTGNLGAANVAVDELFWLGNNTLVAATHGRGLFKAVVAIDPLQISPLTGFAASGYVGGPFGSTNVTFVLTNNSASSLGWSLANTSIWLNVSSTGGTLTPGGGSASLNVSLSAFVTNLAAGSYAATISFTNLSDGYVQSRQFTLQIQTPPDTLIIGPATGVALTGPPGSVSGLSQIFSLTNIGTGPLSWSVNNTSVWLSVSPASGTLSGGSTTTVTVSANVNANTLMLGTYTNTLSFTNRTSTIQQTRPVLIVIQPIVFNGGFETGDFSYWTTSGNFQFCSVSSSPTYVHSGTYGAQMGPSGTLAYLSQTLATVPGQLYSLSFWVNNPNGQTPNEFSAAWNGSNVLDLVSFTAAGWINYQYFVTAPSSSTVIQFGFRNDPDYLAFDDVSVIPVPAPLFQSTSRSGNNINLIWNTQAGLHYQLQTSTNLAVNGWANLGSPFTAPANTLSFIDTNAVLAGRQKFYRLLSYP